MRQTLNTWMTESAKEVLRGDSGERRFRNIESRCFFCFSRLGSQYFPSGFKGIWGWKVPKVCQRCFKVALFSFGRYIIYIFSFKGDLEKKDGRFGGFEARNNTPGFCFKYLNQET